MLPFLTHNSTRLAASLVSTLLILSACSFAPPKVSVTAEPGVQMNSGMSGEALSTVINIYWLKSDAQFSRMTFEQFLGNEKEALEESLIEKHEYVVVPGKTLTLTDDIPQNAQFFGVTAMFHSPAADGWRMVQPVDKLKKVKNALSIRVGACRLTVINGKETASTESPCVSQLNEKTPSQYSQH